MAIKMVKFKKCLALFVLISVIFSNSAYAEIENIIYSNSFAYGIEGLVDMNKTKDTSGYETRIEDGRNVLAFSLGMAKNSTQRSVCAYMGNPNMKSYTLTVEMKGQQTISSEGLIFFNVKSGNEYYALRVSYDGTLRLCKNSLTAEAASNAVSELPKDRKIYYWNTYKIKISGKTVEVYVNGSENACISYEDDDIVTGGSVGLGMQGSTYANAEMWFSDLKVVDESGNTASVKDVLKDSVSYAIGSPNTFIMGEKKLIDSKNLKVTPYIENSRTMIPLRTLAEAMGFEVSYNCGEITVSKNGKVLILYSGSDKCIADGEEYTLTNNIAIKYDRSFVPLRDITELFGKNVLWCDNGIIFISDYDLSFKVNDELAITVSNNFGKPLN